MQNYTITATAPTILVLFLFSLLLLGFILLISDYVRFYYTYWKLERAFRAMAEHYKGQPVSKELLDLADNFKKARKELKIYESEEQ